MYKIKDNVNLEELLKYGFFQSSISMILHREIYNDNLEQYRKGDYLLIYPETKVLVKGKFYCFLSTDGQKKMGYIIKTCRIKRYILDLIQADLVEKVEKKVD